MSELIPLCQRGSLDSALSAHSWTMPIHTPSHSTNLYCRDAKKASSAVLALIRVSIFTFLAFGLSLVFLSAAILSNVGIDTPSIGITSFTSVASSLVFFILNTAFAKSMCIGLKMFIGSIIARPKIISIHLDCIFNQMSYIINPTARNSGHKKGVEALVKQQRPHDQPSKKVT